MIGFWRQSFHRLAPLFILIFFVGCGALQRDRDEVDKLQRQVQALEARLHALEFSQEQIPGVLVRARAAVAYIRAAYAFVDGSGRPLRHVLNEVGEPIADAQGVPLVDLTGTGPVAETEYCGTAFLVSGHGELLTNRHIAEPWWGDDASAPLLAAGLRPIFLRLRAFFEERADPVLLEVLRVHEVEDIALVRTIGWTPSAKPLPLLPDSESPEEGRQVVLIGYPTGISALLAKLEFSERTELEIAAKGNGYAITEMLSRSKQLRPTVTGGHLWEVLPNTLVYDARTTSGGSGGPLLDSQGRVIGVNEAYLPSFQGGNYAVPIRFGQLLLNGGGTRAADSNREILTRIEESATRQEKLNRSGCVRQSLK